ncbi:Cryptochrome-1 [Asimina triloba]
MGTSCGGCSIVWFRRDLRVEDNPALTAGVRSGAVVAVFIWAPEEEGNYYPGRVSRWWLKQSLAHLDSSLRSLGTSLITKRSTDSISSLLDVVKSTSATQLFFNHLYDAVSLVRDHRAKELLSAQGIAVRSFNADLLYEPWEVNDVHGQPFSTFASFWNRCLSMPYDPAAPLLPPKRIISGDVSSCSSDTLIFEDESEKASNALLARAWSPGWSNGDKALTAFINGPLLEYSVNSRKADSATTSLLSPYLHFGELSVRNVFHLVRIKQVAWANEGNTAGEESVNLFLKSIGLREYSRYLSFNHPYSHERPLLAHLKFFPWVVNEGYFKAWRQGRTGYPLVDAGMRELWATGWLHDRIRVVVSSFFVKVLQLPWRWGMKYFWDTLLDADLESDALGWQYISGTLPDGRELDRIDNPQFEGYKFDPNGEYVRRWLPELARLPTEWIHHPWDAPLSVLQAAGVELGSNYPLPIVEIAAAKAKLQEALSEMWQREAASRAAIENGTEEGLGDSSETSVITFPQEIQMEVDHDPREPVRANNMNNATAAVRRHEDQMVPSMTASSLRVEEEEEATSDRLASAGDSRPEVPSTINIAQENRRDVMNQGAVQMTVNNTPQFSAVERDVGMRDATYLPAESSSSSSSRRDRDGGVVPVWSPAVSSHSEQFAGDETGLGSSSYLQRHPQSHQMMNWRQLSQTGRFACLKKDDDVELRICFFLPLLEAEELLEVALFAVIHNLVEFGRAVELNSTYDSKTFIIGIFKEFL